MSNDAMKALLALFDQEQSSKPQQLNEASHPKGYQSTGHFADKKYTDKGLPKPYPKLKDTSTGKVRKHPADKLEEENEHLDPNLSKAYNMGHDAYRAFKNDPERAQAAQDEFDSMEIVKKNPHYAKMWVTGYRDGERFDKQKTNEGSDDNYHHDADELAQGALDAAARYIQDELGIDSGDNAGMFFQGKNLAMIMDVLKQYAQDEMENQRDSDTENVDPSLEEGLEEDLDDDKKKKLTGFVRYLLDFGFKDSTIIRKASARLDVPPREVKKILATIHDEKTNENFGGGMRDRPGSDDKSFDLAECKAFLNKRVLKS